MIAEYKDIAETIGVQRITSTQKGKEAVVQKGNLYEVGYNAAKRAKINKIIYYTTDTPQHLVKTLLNLNKRLTAINVTSNVLAKKLGKKYLIHFIVVWQE